MTLLSMKTLNLTSRSPLVSPATGLNKLGGVTERSQTNPYFAEFTLMRTLQVIRCPRLPMENALSSTDEMTTARTVYLQKGLVGLG